MIILNNKVIKPTIFPDGTSQVWQIEESLFKNDENTILWLFENEAELFHLYQLTLLLRKYCKVGCSTTRLIMPYMPYARQDKGLDNQNSFAQIPFANLINSLFFDEVVVFDVHKDTGLIEKLKNIEPDLSFTEDYDVIIFPDEGAKNRYYHLVDSSKVVTGKKIRDQKTGWIVEYVFNSDVKGKKCIVVDDIADGAKTFEILGKSLKEAKSVDLYVSHGIFSRGLFNILKYGNVYTKGAYNKIITTNSYKPETLKEKTQPDEWIRSHDSNAKKLNVKVIDIVSQMKGNK